ncbi:MAG: 2Fe-2S iron-sulfur cluster-binding protein [Candidatus Kapabacteria bacterium]|nr:2Fe-2S iron-sulfur cluster-binding protein [Candidatus Kapabacteria bacterium]MCS7170257.1 2Fe-2S iron-sulfur cluster-binding protein [Candidatus Kapabacteria bacterium]MDW7996649.1 2Fe-2S iron-sulfur cluster-binding protein [Bacteroidota bacterium]MDW8225223.1 2Fe-2S iron-sulfur cluster-binding protein [Bacteroidota bacterium]
MSDLHSLSPIGKPERTAESPKLQDVQVTVRLYGEQRSFSMQPHERLLYAAIEAGLDAPHSCLSGYCATCRAKLLEGRVHMEINDALTEEEVAQGYILTCQSTPLTERIIVDYDQ